MANVITNLGKRVITSLMRADGTYSEPLYIAWGTGSGTASATDTALFTAAPEARTTGTSSTATTTTTNDTYRITGRVTATASRTITEVGLLTASTGGTLYQHSDFSGISLLADDFIDFTIDTVFS